ncbi:uncharacterized protein IL334_006553 [Kwoniella shivajii]|uniref:SCP domain-containing protein n=1 Tax=Kwoniella shivajii TaxID=564305 RepID=A0ABZ1D691_9TREE|nr:hypothetical protein IL334_006553 [Kwoniella shivajii]
MQLASIFFLSLASLAQAAPYCAPNNVTTTTTTVTVTQWYTQQNAIPSSISKSVSSASTLKTSSVIATPSKSASSSISRSISSSSSVLKPISTSASSLASSTVKSTSVLSTSVAKSTVAVVTSASTVKAQSSQVSSSSKITSASSSQPAKPSASSSTPSDPNAQKLLQLHNAFRAQYGANPVTWNQTLADYATSHATACKFEHTHGPYGENLAAGAGGGYDVTSAFNAWANEASEYNPSNPQYSHFTQVVWKGTTQIGCAMVQCADGTIFSGIGQNSLYVMCEYNPPGNVIGQFAQNVGTKSS